MLSFFLLLLNVWKNAILNVKSKIISRSLCDCILFLSVVVWNVFSISTGSFWMRLWILKKRCAYQFRMYLNRIKSKIEPTWSGIILSIIFHLLHCIRLSLLVLIRLLILCASKIKTIRGLKRKPEFLTLCKNRHTGDFPSSWNHDSGWSTFWLNACKTKGKCLLFFAFISLFFITFSASNKFFEECASFQTNTWNKRKPSRNGNKSKFRSI